MERAALQSVCNKEQLKVLSATHPVLAVNKFVSTFVMRLASDPSLLASNGLAQVAPRASVVIPGAVQTALTCVSYESMQITAVSNPVRGNGL